MKKSLAVAVFTVFSGAAYAGSALEQANAGSIKLQLPVPTAVEAVQTKANEPCSAPAICVGSRVYDSFFKEGTVVAVFSNGKVKVSSKNWNDRYFNVKDLAVGVPCYKGVCENKRVFAPFFGEGTVKEVFNNGKVKVSSKNWNDRYFNVEELALGVQCYKWVCQNDKVLHSFFGTGTAVEVFNNGQVKVSLRNWNSRYINVEELAVEAHCN